MPSASTCDGRLKETQSFSKTSTLEDTQILPVSQPNQNTPLPHRWHSDWARRVPDKDLWPANYWRTSLFPDPPAISPHNIYQRGRLNIIVTLFSMAHIRSKIAELHFFALRKGKWWFFITVSDLGGDDGQLARRIDGFLIHQMGMMAEQLVALYLALIGWSLGGRLDKWKSCEFGDNSLLNECLIEIWKLLGD